MKHIYKKNLNMQNDINSDEMINLDEFSSSK